MQTFKLAISYNLWMKNKQQELIKQLGILVKNERESKSLSQEELAFRCNLHRNQISSIERGLADMHSTTLLSIFKVLNISTSKLEYFKELIQ